MRERPNIALKLQLKNDDQENNIDLGATWRSFLLFKFYSFTSVLIASYSTQGAARVLLGVKGRVPMLTRKIHSKFLQNRKGDRYEDIGRIGICFLQSF